MSNNSLSPFLVSIFAVLFLLHCVKIRSTEPLRDSNILQISEQPGTEPISSLIVTTYPIVISPETTFTTEQVVNIGSASSTVSLLVALNSQANNYIYIKEIIQPDGLIITSEEKFADNPGISLLNSPNRIAMPSLPGYASASIPSNAAIQVQEGNYKFTLGAINPETIQNPIELTLTVIQKVISPIESMNYAKIPVNLYLGSHLNIEDQQFIDSLDTQLNSPYASIDTEIFFENILPLPEPFTETFPDDLDLLQQLGKLPSENGAINLVVLESGAGPGWSMGLPGAAPLPNAFGNAVIVSTYQNPQAGKNAAHELGHYLGLYHVIEQFDPNIKDQLSDTDGGPSNLMYPNTPNGGQITPLQKKIIWGHPAVKIYP